MYCVSCSRAQSGFSGMLGITAQEKACARNAAGSDGERSWGSTMIVAGV